MIPTVQTAINKQQQVFVSFFFPKNLIFLSSFNQISIALNILKRYPTVMIPTVQTAINKTSSFDFTAFFSIIRDGRLNVVTAIICPH